jgi:hypothetical protein
VVAHLAAVRPVAGVCGGVVLGFSSGDGFKVNVLLILVLGFGVEGSLILAGGERSLANIGKVALPEKVRRSRSAYIFMHPILG